MIVATCSSWNYTIDMTMKTKDNAVLVYSTDKVVKK